MSVKWLHMGQWPCYVGFTRSEADFQREMKRLKIKDIDFLASDHACATTHRLEGEGTMVIIITLTSKKATREQEAALVAHEAMHAVQYIKEEYNRNHDFGVESEAYLLQYIVQECLQEAWKTKRSRSSKPTP